MESRETNNDCSSDLFPNGQWLVWKQRESEEESSSAESENDSVNEVGSNASSSENREGSDANEDSSDANSGGPVEPEKGDNWTPVTSRRQGSKRVPSPSSIGWSKLQCMPMNDDAALVDIESAMHNHYFSKILQIEGLHTSNKVVTDIFKITSQLNPKIHILSSNSCFRLNAVKHI